jgi:hypothetical protein
MSKIRIHAAPLFDWHTHWATLEVIHPVSSALSNPWDPDKPYADDTSKCIGKNVVRISLTGSRAGKKGNIIFTREQLQEFISALSVMEKQL